MGRFALQQFVIQVDDLLCHSSSGGFHNNDFRLVGIIHFPESQAGRILEQFFAGTPIYLPVRLFGIELAQEPVHIRKGCNRSVIARIRRQKLTDKNRNTFRLVVADLKSAVRQQCRGNQEGVLRSILSGSPPVFVLRKKDTRSNLYFTFLVIRLLLPFREKQGNVFAKYKFRNLVTYPQCNPRFFL